MSRRVPEPGGEGGISQSEAREGAASCCRDRLRTRDTGGGATRGKETRRRGKCEKKGSGQRTKKKRKNIKKRTRWRCSVAPHVRERKGAKGLTPQAVVYEGGSLCTCEEGERSAGKKKKKTQKTNQVQGRHAQDSPLTSHACTRGGPCAPVRKG
jgi:hypothetical protein